MATSPTHTDTEFTSNRRAFLSRSGVGIGSMALSCLLQRQTAATSTSPISGGPGGKTLSSHRGQPGLPHVPFRVKRVIFLYMAGGPSHLETFDYKPELVKQHGQLMPNSITAGQPIAQLQGSELRAHRPMFQFGQYGTNGQWISELLPWHQKMADRICIIKSMVAEQINHDPAHTFMNTGTAISGRPSMGAWITYGLGSETDNLPGFVVMTSVTHGRNPQPIASRQWSSGFLPSRFQGVELNSVGDPVHYVRSPPGVSRQVQRSTVDAIQQLDRRHNQIDQDLELDARIVAFETAFRMQSTVPDLVDLSDEPDHVLKLYGATPGDGSFASNCLMARRLAERGVRFIQLYHRDWDHHDGLQKYIKTCSEDTDQASYALLTDLEQRGMLDDTLVIWGGEFGRTPMVQTDKGAPGRDHHIKGFSMWLAGGGVKGGISHGATDDFGYHAAVRPVHIRDLHATILHLLGIDDRRFVYRFQGLDMRLTGVDDAHVVNEILT
jgi:hypothetical protein